MPKSSITLQIRPDSATRTRTAYFYGVFRNETLVGRARQLDKLPASEALSLARRYVDITSGLNLKPGISVPANLGGESPYRHGGR